MLISGYYPEQGVSLYSQRIIPRLFMNSAAPMLAVQVQVGCKGHFLGGTNKLTRSSNVHKYATHRRTQLTEDTRRTYTRRSSSMSTCAVAARDGLLRLVEVR